MLWVIGAVVFWQAEKATGQEDWSHIKTKYFTFVALITVRYGDFLPQTNSAKPTFVFWSLIALPALTVLIGAIGDAVPDFVAALTLWLGKNTLKSLGIYMV
jgi:potassium channel subfamily K, other eukaryote